MHVSRLFLINMTIRESAIDKLQKLPDSLLRQVNDFIDFLTYKHQTRPEINTAQTISTTETWTRWFESVDQLQVNSTEAVGDYQQHLLSKYRQQGLEL